MPAEATARAGFAWHCPRHPAAAAGRLGWPSRSWAAAHASRPPRPSPLCRHRRAPPPPRGLASTACRRPPPLEGSAGQALGYQAVASQWRPPLPPATPFRCGRTPAREPRPSLPSRSYLWGGGGLPPPRRVDARGRHSTTSLYPPPLTAPMVRVGGSRGGRHPGAPPRGPHKTIHAATDGPQRPALPHPHPPPPPVKAAMPPCRPRPCHSAPILRASPGRPPSRVHPGPAPPRPRPTPRPADRRWRVESGSCGAEAWHPQGAAADAFCVGRRPTRQPPAVDTP